MALPWAKGAKLMSSSRNFSRVVNIRKVKWALDRAVGSGIMVRLRSSQQRAYAVIKSVNDDGTASIELEEPYRAPAPGQACIMYDMVQGDVVVVGGGVIY
jgi:tRNA U34 2-thiouridine synthase MnmA/TrmU